MGGCLGRHCEDTAWLREGREAFNHHGLSLHENLERNSPGQGQRSLLLLLTELQKLLTVSPSHLPERGGLWVGGPETAPMGTDWHSWDGWAMQERRLWGDLIHSFSA